MAVCRVEGCAEKHSAKGYCKLHYFRLTKIRSKITSTSRLCTAEDCGRKHFGLGYCDKHYYQFKKHGRLILEKEKGRIDCMKENCDSRRYRSGFCKEHFIEHHEETAQRCSVKSCGRPMLAKSYCSLHYRRWKLYGDPEKGAKSRGVCNVPGCNQGQKGRHLATKELCEKHWMQMKRRGRILEPHEEGYAWKRHPTGICEIDGCKEKHYEGGLCVTHARLHRKKRAVDYKGGRCQLCGYYKYAGSLQFHHLDPNKKDGEVSSALHWKWERQKKILDSCVLLCANCHFEIHHNKFEMEKAA